MEGAGRGPSHKSRRSLHVLLAEDDPVNRALLVRLMERSGHTSVAVENGRDALRALEQASFDLVLMDVKMPEMDGVEATRAIRAREKESGAHLPILAVTAYDTKETRDRCIHAGVDAITVKPIRADDLTSAIERVIMLRD